MSALASFLIPPWLTWGLVIIAAFPLVGGLTVLASEFLQGKRETRSRLCRTLVVAGGLLCILGAFMGAIEQGKDTYNLWAVSTGGEDYCYLAYILNTSKNLKFVISNDGSLPLYDINMEINNWNEWQKIKAAHPEIFARPGTSIPSDELFEWEKEANTDIHVGNLSPTEHRLIWEAPLPQDVLQRYSVAIWARNGLFDEDILIRRTPSGGYVWAFRVQKSGAVQSKGKFKPKLLKVDVQDGFRKFYPKEIPWSGKGK